MVTKITTPAATAFDALAGTYDENFSRSRLGQLLRPRVWQALGEQFLPGQHVLELACGTGEDAVWLAQRGVQVTATDGSAEMVRVAGAKVNSAGLAGRVSVQQISLQQVVQSQLAELPPSNSPQTRLIKKSNLGSDWWISPSPNLPSVARWEGNQTSPLAGGGEGGLSAKTGITGQPSAVGGQYFDGVYSNFGGLNTIGDWRPLAQALAKVVKPGGKVILTPMGPFCLWEISWHLLHGQPKPAFRRFRSNALAKVGDSLILIWYPSARRLRTDFAPWFHHMGTASLGLWLPPSYLEHFVNRWPKLFAWLNRLEQATARLTQDWGDHYLIVFKRK